MTELIGATALERDVKDELPLGSESSASCLLLLLYDHPNRCVDVQRLQIINNGRYMMVCGMYKLPAESVIGLHIEHDYAVKTVKGHICSLQGP